MQPLLSVARLPAHLATALVTPYFPLPAAGNRALEVGERFQANASESSGPCPQLPSIAPGMGWHTLGTTGSQRLQGLQCPGLLLAIRGRIFGHSRSLPTKQNLPECKHSSNAPQELFPSPQVSTGRLMGTQTTA